MARIGIYTCFLLVILFNLSDGQLPPRLQIPGAQLYTQPQQQPRLSPAGRQRLQQLDAPAPRPRGRPIPQNAIPIREVRPVVEEPEEEPQQSLQTHQIHQTHQSFDDEVARLGLSSLQSGLQQVDEETIQFRPEPRPIPVLRQDIRDVPVSRPIPVQAKPLPLVRQERPVIRQELKQEQAFARPVPVRQEYREELPVQQVRRPAPQPIRQQAPQPVRHQPQAARIPSRPAPQYLDDDVETRSRKPPVQILRKYRTDNPDGSITWGYENEDGSFKEETIGIDCITRGKYGYIDPDNVKREYTYETGGKCEEPEDELEDLPPQAVAAKGGKKPYRPQPQYIN